MGYPMQLIKKGIVGTRHDKIVKLVKKVDSGKKNFKFLKPFGHFSDLPQLN